MAYSIDRMPERISIGRETETGVTDVMIDCGAWVRKWPGMTLHAIYTPEGGAPYILQTETDGGVLVWHVTDADTAKPGTGSMEIVGEMDGRRKVSATVKVSVVARMSGTVGEPPEAAKPWADRVVEAAERITGMHVLAETLDAGSGATAAWDGEQGLLTIGVPKGDQGPKGEKGEKGPQGEKGEPGKDAVVDATLTKEGQAADAKATGDVVSQLKNDMSKLFERTTQLFDVSDTSFVTKTMAVNSSGKCVFYGSDAYQYRSIIFPALNAANYGLYAKIPNASITSIKLCRFNQQPVAGGGDFIATASVTSSYVDGAFRAVLSSDGSEQYIVVAATFTSGVDYDAMIDLIKGNLYIFDTDAINYNTQDWSKVKYEPYMAPAVDQSVRDEIDNKVDKLVGFGLSQNNFSDVYKAALESLQYPDDVIIKTGDNGITSGSWCNPTTGVIASTTSTAVYDMTGLIPCSVGDTIYVCYAQSVVFFKQDGSYSSGITIANVPGYVGNAATNIIEITDTNAAYMRINFFNAGYSSSLTGGLYAACRIMSDPYRVVNLGDSIFGLNPKPYDASTALQKMASAKTANCGFGGTRAATHGDANINKFSLFNIADSIASGDYSLQDGADFTQSATKTYYRFNLNTLKSVDFSGVDVITIAFGTNDWNANVPLDNADNKTDTSTYCGALRYSIEKILGAYPNINIVLCAPLYRTFDNGDSDTVPNSSGKYLRDYCDAMKAVAEEYHLMFCDNYRESGINKANSGVFFRDGTHLTFTDGAKRVGTIIGGKIRGIIS